MWVLDAAQINIGGAVSILILLVEELNRQEIAYILIKDSRLKIDIKGPVTTVVPKRPILGRQNVYKAIMRKYNITRVISLINFPPPVDLGIPTVTYFHNMNILSSANIQNFGWKYKLMQHIKRRYLKRKLKNTHYFIFQSIKAQADFLGEYQFPELDCKIFPFYDQLRIEKVKNLNLEKKPESFIYISLDYPHKNHKLLLDVWESLLSKNLTPALTLSIPFENTELTSRIRSLNQKGCQINNLGVTEYEVCLKETSKSQYCIYPSKSESLGLGLVESQILGNKILASDLGYVHQAITPSAVFDPESLESIEECVLSALNTNLPDTHLKLTNRLEDFITFVRTIENPI